MSKIEWTNKTWNPIVGCTKISEGCKNCYAEKMAVRLKGIEETTLKYQDVITLGKWNDNVHFDNHSINKPYDWKKPSMIFVCSMGDLFHENIPFEWILKVFAIMYECPKHTFQILTKRPKRALDCISWKWEQKSIPWFQKDDIWFGVTVENQEQANKRIPELLKIPAKIHFLSCEPLLSNIDLTYFISYEDCENCNGSGSIPVDDGGVSCPECLESSNGLGKILKLPFDWVIAGPETGSSKRPMKREWIENLYQQCKVAGVPFFDKKNVLGLGLKQFPILKF